MSQATMRDEDDDLDLRQYVEVLSRNRRLIAGAALVCGLVAFLVSMLSARLYEAEASLAISRPKIAGDPIVDTTAVANFVPFIANRGIAAQVIKEFDLAKPPYKASPTTFFGTYVRVEEVRNSTLLLVKGTLDDPALVTNVVNRIAKLAVERARDASKAEALQAQEDLKIELTGALKRMDDADAKLRVFRDQAQIEVLKKDVTAALEERSGLLELSINIEKEKSRLAKAEEELAAHKKIDTVTRTLDSEPAMVEAARRTNPPADLLGLEMKSQVVSPVYEAIDRSVATSRANLAALQRQRDQMKQRKLDGPKLAMLTDLYTKEAELARLEMDRDLSHKVYTEVATSYENARRTVAGRTSALQITGDATVPDRPLSRNVVRNTAFAMAGGLVLGALVALLRGLFGPSSAPVRSTATR